MCDKECFHQQRMSATFNAEALCSLLQGALGIVSKLPPKQRSIRNWYCFHTSSFFR